MFFSCNSHGTNYLFPCRWARRGDVWEAADLMQQMKREGVQPDIHTYTSFINACSKAGDMQVSAIYRTCLTCIINIFWPYVFESSIKKIRTKLLLKQVKGYRLDQYKRRKAHCKKDSNWVEGMKQHENYEKDSNFYYLMKILGWRK